MIVAILAKERGGTPTGTPNSPGSVIVRYDLAATPSTPIHVGQQINIYALIPCNSLFLSERSTDRRRYTAYEAGVRGTVVAVRAMELDIVEFVIRNDNRRSWTTHAYLSAQNIQNETVQVDRWTRIVHRWLLPTNQPTRRIPLEDDALIYRGDSDAATTRSDDPFRFTMPTCSSDDEAGAGGSRDGENRAGGSGRRDTGDDGTDESDEERGTGDDETDGSDGERDS